MSASNATRTIAPRSGALDAVITVPGSKSYTNRALVLAALATGSSTLNGALFSDDTLYMADALSQLGFPVRKDAGSRTFSVGGAGGHVPNSEADVFVGNSGTTARFLTVLMTLGTGSYRLDGVARMRDRPIHPLLKALKSLGAHIRGEFDDDRIPLLIEASGLRGGAVHVPGNLSSQYITGLLLCAPCMARGLQLTVEGQLVSRPYVEMTRQAMADFGVQTDQDGSVFSVPSARYAARSYDVEPDASAASYFFGAAAILGGRVTVRGLGRASLQGDLRLVHVLERMGCAVRMRDGETTVIGPGRDRLQGVEVNMADLSDVAQTLAVVAPFASSPTRITGIGFIRGKETDRVRAVVNELKRLGVRAVEEDDGLTVYPSTPTGGQVATYEDHRMAMSFSLIGLRVPGVEIADPGCAAKTFPEFFDVLETL